LVTGGSVVLPAGTRKPYGTWVSSGAIAPDQMWQALYGLLT
jgi:hypothetical protein